MFGQLTYDATRSLSQVERAQSASVKPHVLGKVVGPYTPRAVVGGIREKRKIRDEGRQCGGCCGKLQLGYMRSIL